MATAKLVSMKMDPKEAEEYAGPTSLAAKDQPAYPWGLCVNLENDSLEKLGMTDLPEVGATLQLTARVTVTSVSSNQTEGNEPRRCVNLQITDMALGPAPAEPSATKSATKQLYGADDTEA